MLEILLWGVRIAVVLFVLVLVAVFVVFQISEDRYEREKYKDRDQPFFQQTVEIGSPFGVRSTTKRWKAWAGALAVPLLWLLLWLLTGRP